MNNKKILLRSAIKAGILSLSIISSSQAYALSLAEPSVIDELTPPVHLFEMIDKVFSAADANRDGQLSVDEFYRLHEQASLMAFDVAFRVIDTDRSGTVNMDEFVTFLPAEYEEAAQTQFKAAAGDDGEMDAKEFAEMRLQEQGANPDLLWKFALADHDRNGQLALAEYHTGQASPEVIIAPPSIIMDGPVQPEPEVITVLPPVIMDGVMQPEPEVITAPPPMIMDGVRQPEPEVIDVITTPSPIILDGSVKPEPEITEVTPVPPPIIVDGSFKPEPEVTEVTTAPPPIILDGSIRSEPEVTPVPPSIVLDGSIRPEPVVTTAPPPIILDGLMQEPEVEKEGETQALQEQLKAVETRINKIERSMALAMGKMGKATNAKAVARLERRIARQAKRLDKFQQQQQMLMDKLGQVEN